MDHIELAISVLEKEISVLQYDIKYSHLSPEEEEQWNLELKDLNKAINEIQKKLLV